MRKVGSFGGGRSALGWAHPGFVALGKKRHASEVNDDFDGIIR